MVVSSNSGYLRFLRLLYCAALLCCLAFADGEVRTYETLRLENGYVDCNVYSKELTGKDFNMSDRLLTVLACGNNYQIYLSSELATGTVSLAKKDVVPITAVHETYDTIPGISFVRDRNLIFKTWVQQPTNGFGDPEIKVEQLFEVPYNDRFTESSSLTIDMVIVNQVYVCVVWSDHSMNLYLIDFFTQTLSFRTEVQASYQMLGIEKFYTFTADPVSVNDLKQVELVWAENPQRGQNSINRQLIYYETTVQNTTDPTTGAVTQINGEPILQFKEIGIYNVDQMVSSISTSDQFIAIGDKDYNSYNGRVQILQRNTLGALSWFQGDRGQNNIRLGSQTQIQDFDDYSIIYSTSQTVEPEQNRQYYVNYIVAHKFKGAYAFKFYPKAVAQPAKIPQKGDLFFGLWDRYVIFKYLRGVTVYRGSICNLSEVYYEETVGNVLTQLCAPCPEDTVALSLDSTSCSTCQSVLQNLESVFYDPFIDLLTQERCTGEYVIIPSPEPEPPKSENPSEVSEGNNTNGESNPIIPESENNAGSTSGSGSGSNTEVVETTESAGGSLSGGAIAGIIIAVILVLCCGGTILYMFKFGGKQKLMNIFKDDPKKKETPKPTKQGPSPKQATKMDLNNSEDADEMDIEEGEKPKRNFKGPLTLGKGLTSIETGSVEKLRNQSMDPTAADGFKSAQNGTVSDILDINQINFSTAKGTTPGTVAFGSTNKKIMHIQEEDSDDGLSEREKKMKAMKKLQRNLYDPNKEDDFFEEEVAQIELKSPSKQILQSSGDDTYEEDEEMKTPTRGLTQGRSRDATPDPVMDFINLQKRQSSNLGNREAPDIRVAGNRQNSQKVHDEDSVGEEDELCVAAINYLLNELVNMAYVLVWTDLIEPTGSSISIPCLKNMNQLLPDKRTLFDIYGTREVKLKIVDRRLHVISVSNPQMENKPIK